MSNYFTIAIVGSGGCGKSTLIHRHTTGQFKRQYEPTNPVDVETLNFNTNHGLVHLLLLDMGGQWKHMQRDDYYYHVDGAIVMFDLTSKMSFRETKYWLDEIQFVRPEIPIILIGNKTDIKERKVKAKELQELAISSDVDECYETSAKSNYNFEMPFLALMREMTGHPDLQFTEQLESHAI